MDKILKIIKKYKWLLVFAVCILWYIWYAHPKNIQDGFEIVNIESREHYYLKLDIYQKKSLVQKTQCYGSVWIEGEEYTAPYSKLSLQRIGEKIKELLDSSNLNLEELLGGTIFFSVNESNRNQWLCDYLWVVDYNAEDHTICLILSVKDCPFAAGLYLDKEASLNY